MKILRGPARSTGPWVITDEFPLQERAKKNSLSVRANVTKTNNERYSDAEVEFDIADIIHLNSIALKRLQVQQSRLEKAVGERNDLFKYLIDERAILRSQNSDGEKLEELKKLSAQVREKI